MRGSTGSCLRGSRQASSQGFSIVAASMNESGASLCSAARAVTMSVMTTKSPQALPELWPWLAPRAALPILLHRSGLDAAHAGPAIQVLMDIVGVSITCLICAQLFSYFGVH